MPPAAVTDPASSWWGSPVQQPPQSSETVSSHSRALARISFVERGTSLFFAYPPPVPFGGWGSPAAA